MKKFLLLCVLFVACLAPCAEGKVSVTVTDGQDVGQKIVDALTPAPAPEETTIEVTIQAPSANSAVISSTITVPYKDTVNDRSFTTIIVKGDGTAGRTIKVNPNQRHFKVENEGTLNIEGVTLTGTGPDTVGGGVATAGKTSFTNVTFNNNKAENGGAVEVTGGTTTFSGTNTFTGNQATQNGGAIYYNGEEDTLELPANLTLTNNTATGNGGAIALAAGKSLTLNGTNGNVTGNNAANGGVIYAAGESTIRFNGALSFTKNGAATTTKGGVIYSEGALTLAGAGAATFGGSADNANKATEGGAVYSKNKLTLNNSNLTFSYNEATDGGAIALADDANLTFTSKATITHNHATDGGGAIYAAGKSTITFDSEQSFTGNGSTDGKTTLKGGAIYSKGALTLAGTSAATFGGSADNANKATEGGAIYSTGTLTLGKAKHEFNGNQATNSGGAIYTKMTAELAIENQEFESNQAEGTAAAAAKGGAIYTEGPVTVKKGTFKENKAGNIPAAGDTTPGSGGAIHAEAKVVTVTDGTFTGNIATVSGGAIYAGTANINGGTFTSNIAKGTKEDTGGGAVYAATVTVTGTATSPEFKGNKAETGNGGAIYATGKVDLQAGAFGDKDNPNIAKNGGAIYAGDAVTLTTGTSTFTAKNQATENGGAIYSKETIETKDRNFSNQTAAISGGALYAENTIIVDGGTFSKNTTTDPTAVPKDHVGGGAIYSGTDVIVMGEELQFHENSSENGASTYSGGGAIYAKRDVKVEAGSFTSNTSKSTGEHSGGGAIWAGRKVTVEANAGNISGNSNAENDQPHSGGGAIHAEGDVDIEGGRFFKNISNSAGGDHSGGGAIWSGGDGNTNQGVTVTGGDFACAEGDKNLAVANGGAIYAIKAITIKQRRDGEPFIFSNQEAKSGGALYSEGTIEATGAIFIKNTANDSHGGATFSGGVSTFSNCLFGGQDQENTAKRNGGAVLANGLKAQYCTFYGNYAGWNGGAGSGGAVSVAKGEKNSIDNCVFEYNTAALSGGAVLEDGEGVELTITESAFLPRNSAGDSGGAICTSASPASLTLERCTFQRNFSKNDGGAANIEVSDFFRIVNCTFYGNYSTAGSGGALQLAGNRRGSSLVFNTIAKNEATKGNGGGISSTATFDIGANIVVGNKAKLGSDIYANGGKMTSLGYNYFAYYGERDNDRAWRNAQWADPDLDTDKVPEPGKVEESDIKFEIFFISGDETVPMPNDNIHKAIPGKNPPAIGAYDPPITEEYGLISRTLNTLALRVPNPDIPDERDNPVVARIPYAKAITIYGAGSKTDERNVSRPSGTGRTWDVGAYDTREGDNSSDHPEDDKGVIKHIVISGVPNTLHITGQHASLFVVGFDRDWNEIDSNVKDIEWSPDSILNGSGVVVLDKDTGNIRAQRLGNVRIIASLMSNPAIQDYVDVSVTEEGEPGDSNIHPDWWNRLELQQLIYENMMLDTAYIASGISTVKTFAFRKEFKASWDATVSLVSDSTSVVANSPTAIPARTKDDIKPGISLSVSNLEKGSILPLKYSWTLDYNQLSMLLDRNVTTPPSAAELAKVVRIDFENIKSVRVPVIDGSNGGTFNVSTAQYDKVGVKALDAALTGALRVQQSASKDGATISLTAYLANVDDPNNKGAQLVERLLVVPDGVADGGISGTMWMSKKAESSSNNNNNNNNNNSNSGSGGGGGGGCDATGLGLAVLLLALPLLARRRR